MKPTVPQRSGFMTHGELLERAIQWSDAISGRLLVLRPEVRDPRAAIHLEELIEMQRRITRLISAYRRRAPERVLDSYVQTTRHARLDRERPIESPPDIAALTRLSVALNTQLCEEFQLLAAKGSIEARELFDELARALDHARHAVSREDGTVRDI